MDLGNVHHWLPFAALLASDNEMQSLKRPLLTRLIEMSFAAFLAVIGGIYVSDIHQTDQITAQTNQLQELGNKLVQYNDNTNRHIDEVNKNAEAARQQITTQVAELRVWILTHPYPAKQ
jgi:cell division protein FtsB